MHSLKEDAEHKQHVFQYQCLTKVRLTAYKAPAILTDGGSITYYLMKMKSRSGRVI